MAKVIFKCFLKEVKDKFPIQKISSKDFKWFDRMNKFYQDNPRKVQTNKCPGILSTLQTGWIQKTYQPITITTNGDKKTFSWHTPYNQKKGENGFLIDNYVSSHEYDQLAKFKNLGDSVLDTVIKIQSPWRVIIPKDYYLLSTAIPYNDDVNFTAATGLLMGENFLNVQLFWHKLKGDYTIPSGTPLCYYLLIKKEKFHSEISMLNNEEIDIIKQDQINFFNKKLKS